MSEIAAGGELFCLWSSLKNAFSGCSAPFTFHRLNQSTRNQLENLKRSTSRFHFENLILTKAARYGSIQTNYFWHLASHVVVAAVVVVVGAVVIGRLAMT